MQLAELTVRGFADLLGSDAPAPGGGSAAALAGDLGGGADRHGGVPDRGTEEVRRV